MVKKKKAKTESICVLADFIRVKWRAAKTVDPV